MANDDHPVSGPWDEQPGLFLEGEHRPTVLEHRSRRRQRMAVAAAAVMCVAVVGVPVGLVLASGGPSPTPSAHSTGHHSKVGNGGRLGNGPAEHQVLSALSATTASGNFDVNYDLTQSSGSASSTTATTCVSINVAPSLAQEGGAADTTGPNSDPPTDTTVTRACGAGPKDASVQGQGTIDVNPMAMAVSADVSSFGSLAIRVDGTNYWELGAGDNGLAPLPTDTGAGSPLSSFAGLVEGTLGQREGAIAMMGMASPTGFLDLSQQAVTGAAEVGTGEVGGKSVTEYEVSIDLAQLAQVPGITTEEANTIQAAVGVLDQAGYTGTMVKVAIDDAGFIREVTPVASFSDGGTVTLDATFTNFGCAGTVLMPDQQGATSPPAGCVSTDTTATAPPTTDSATSTTG